MKSTGRIELPRGKTANERAKESVTYPTRLQDAPGPLERHKLANYCEMCGVAHYRFRLEAGFDPSGQVKTLCAECRIGSAELREERLQTAVKALQGVLHHHNASKAEYQLPQSLVRHIESALKAVQS